MRLKVIRNIIIALASVYGFSCFTWWTFDVWNVSKYNAFERGYFFIVMLVIVGFTGWFTILFGDKNHE